MFLNLGKRNALAGLGFFWATSLWAYVPPAEFIVTNWASKHATGSRTLKIQCAVTAYSDNSPTDTHFRETITYNPSASRFRSVALDESGRKLFSLSRDVDSLPLVVKLLFATDGNRVVAGLRDRGIPIHQEEGGSRSQHGGEQATLVRLKDSIAELAWVIAATPSSKEKDKDKLFPQVWFEKDTFFPIRLVYTEPRDSTVYDFQFGGYQNFSTSAYPKTVTVKTKADGILFSSVATDLSLGSEESYSTFGTELGLTEAGKSASYSVRSLIQQYYGILR